MKRYARKRYAFAAVVLLVALIASRVLRTYVTTNLARERGAITAEYTFIDGKTARAVFHQGEKARVELTLSDGRRMVLPQAISASVARYANQNESIVFWIKDDTAFLEENGKQTYRDGKAAQAVDPTQHH